MYIRLLPILCALNFRFFLFVACSAPPLWVCFFSPFHHFFNFTINVRISYAISLFEELQIYDRLLFYFIEFVFFLLFFSVKMSKNSIEMLQLATVHPFLWLFKRESSFLVFWLLIRSNEYGRNSHMFNEINYNLTVAATNKYHQILLTKI